MFPLSHSRAATNRKLKRLTWVASQMLNAIWHSLRELRFFFVNYVNLFCSKKDFRCSIHFVEGYVTNHTRSQVVLAQSSSLPIISDLRKSESKASLGTSCNPRLVVVAAYAEIRKNPRQM